MKETTIEKSRNVDIEVKLKYSVLYGIRIEAKRAKIMTHTRALDLIESDREEINHPAGQQTCINHERGQRYGQFEINPPTPSGSPSRFDPSQTMFRMSLPCRRSSVASPEANVRMFLRYYTEELL